MTLRPRNFSTSKFPDSALLDSVTSRLRDSAILKETCLSETFQFLPWTNLSTFLIPSTSLISEMNRRVNFYPPVYVDSCDQDCVWTQVSLSTLQRSEQNLRTTYDVYKYLIDFMTSKLSIIDLELHEQSCRMCVTAGLLNYVVGKLL